MLAIRVPSLGQGSLHLQCAPHEPAPSPILFNIVQTCCQDNLGVAGRSVQPFYSMMDWGQDLPSLSFNLSDSRWLVAAAANPFGYKHTSWKTLDTITDDPYCHDICE